MRWMVKSLSSEGITANQDRRPSALHDWLRHGTLDGTIRPLVSGFEAQMVVVLFEGRVNGPVFGQLWRRRPWSIVGAG